VRANLSVFRDTCGERFPKKQAFLAYSFQADGVPPGSFEAEIALRNSSEMARICCGVAAIFRNLKPPHLNSISDVAKNCSMAATKPAARIAS
jgi:hypothetical protein